MSTGIFIPDLKTGDVMIAEPVLRDDKTSLWPRVANIPLPYRAYATIRRRISLRGATLLSLTATDEIVPELTALEKDLFYLSGKPVKDLFFQERFPDDIPEEDDPLQTPQPVRDGRLVLAAFNGIGPVKANAMWKSVEAWMEEHRSRLGEEKEDWLPNTMQLLVWASLSGKSRKMAGLPKVPGWGDKTYESIREQLGLEEGMELRVEVLKEEKT